MKTKYVYLKNKYLDEIVAVKKNEIETVRLSDCFDKYGNKIGHFNAEDYCLSNEIGEAMMDLIISISDTFYIDADDIELIETDNNVFVIDPVCCIDDEQEKRINEYIKKWQSKNEKFVEALAITYFDGHNWQSEILEIDGIGNDYSDYFIIDDSEIEVDLDEAFEEMVFLKKEDWYDVYESPNHYFLKGYTPFGDYTIVEN